MQAAFTYIHMNRGPRNKYIYIYIYIYVYIHIYIYIHIIHIASHPTCYHNMSYYMVALRAALQKARSRDSPGRPDQILLCPVDDVRAVELELALSCGIRRPKSRLVFQRILDASRTKRVRDRHLALLLLAFHPRRSSGRTGACPFP